MHVVALELFQELSKVGFDQLGMPLDALAHRPAGTLSYAIYRTEKQPHQLSELFRVVSNIFDDLLGLSLGMDLEECVANVHLSDESVPPIMSVAIFELSMSADKDKPKPAIDTITSIVRLISDV